MAIKTSTFDGVTLTGDSAKTFRKQFIDTLPQRNKAAEESLARGIKMLKEADQNGVVKVQINKK